MDELVLEEVLLVEDDYDLDLLLDEAAGGVRLPERGAFDYPLEEAFWKKPFQKERHPRWPPGTKNAQGENIGGRFMTVGQHFRVDGKEWEVAHVTTGGKLYAHAASGKYADVETRAFKGKKAKDGGYDLEGAKPAKPHIIKGGGKGDWAEGNVPIVDPYVDKASHDPSIGIPPGATLSPEEWQRFGKIDQEHFVDVMERFGPWQNAAATTFHKEILKDYDTTLKDLVTKFTYANAGSSSGWTASLTTVFTKKGLKGLATHGPGYDNDLLTDPAEIAEAFALRERLKELQADLASVVQWDLYNRTNAPDVAIFHKSNQHSPSKWKKDWINGSKPVFSGLSQSTHYRPYFWASSTIATPMAIRHVVANENSVHWSSFKLGENEAMVADQYMIDERSMTFTKAGGSDSPLTALADKWLEGATKSPKGGHVLAELKAHMEQGAPLDVPAEPPNLQLGGQGGVLWLPPPPGAATTTKNWALPEENPGEEVIEPAAFAELKKAGNFTPEFSHVDEAHGGPASMAASDQGFKPGDYMIGKRGAFYWIGADPSSSSNLRYHKIVDGAFTGESWELTNERKAYRLTGPDGFTFPEPPPKPDEGVPGFVAAEWFPSKDEKFVGALKKGDKFKLNGAHYELEADGSMTGTTVQVKSLESGKIASINVGYKTAILEHVSGATPDLSSPPPAALYPEGTEVVVTPPYGMAYLATVSGEQAEGAYTVVLPSGTPVTGITEGKLSLPKQQSPKAKGVEVGDWFSYNGKRHVVTALPKSGTVRAKPQGGGKVQSFAPPGTSVVIVGVPEMPDDVFRPGDWMHDPSSKVKVADLSPGDLFDLGAGSKLRPARVLSKTHKGIDYVDLDTGLKSTFTNKKLVRAIVPKGEIDVEASQSTPTDAGLAASEGKFDIDKYTLGPMTPFSEIPVGGLGVTKNGLAFKKLSDAKVLNLNVGLEVDSGYTKGADKPFALLVPKAGTDIPYGALTPGDSATLKVLAPGDQFKMGAGLYQVVGPGGDAEDEPGVKLAAVGENGDVLDGGHVISGDTTVELHAKAGTAVPPGDVDYTALPEAEFDAYKSKWGSGGKYKHDLVGDMVVGMHLRDKAGVEWIVKAGEKNGLVVVSDGEKNYRVKASLRGRVLDEHGLIDGAPAVLASQQPPKPKPEVAAGPGALMDEPEVPRGPLVKGSEMDASFVGKTVVQSDDPEDPGAPGVGTVFKITKVETSTAGVVKGVHGEVVSKGPTTVSNPGSVASMGTVNSFVVLDEPSSSTPPVLSLDELSDALSTGWNGVEPLYYSTPGGKVAKVVYGSEYTVTSDGEELVTGDQFAAAYALMAGGFVNPGRGPSGGLAKGDKVQITDGPWAGKTGTVADLEPNVGTAPDSVSVATDDGLEGLVDKKNLAPSSGGAAYPAAALQVGDVFHFTEGGSVHSPSGYKVTAADGGVLKAKSLDTGNVWEGETAGPDEVELVSKASGGATVQVSHTNELEVGDTYTVGTHGLTWEVGEPAEGKPEGTVGIKVVAKGGSATSAYSVGYTSHLTPGAFSQEVVKASAHPGPDPEMMLGKLPLGASLTDGSATWKVKSFKDGEMAFEQQGPSHLTYTVGQAMTLADAATSPTFGFEGPLKVVDPAAPPKVKLKGPDLEPGDEFFIGGNATGSTFEFVSHADGATPAQIKVVKANAPGGEGAQPGEVIPWGSGTSDTPDVSITVLADTPPTGDDAFFQNLANGDKAIWLVGNAKVPTPVTVTDNQISGPGIQVTATDGPFKNEQHIVLSGELVPRLPSEPDYDSYIDDDFWPDGVPLPGVGDTIWFNGLYGKHKKGVVTASNPDADTWTVAPDDGSAPVDLPAMNLLRPGDPAPSLAPGDTLSSINAKGVEVGDLITSKVTDTTYVVKGKSGEYDFEFAAANDLGAHKWNTAEGGYFVNGVLVFKGKGDDLGQGSPSDPLEPYKSKYGSGGTYTHDMIGHLDVGTVFQDKTKKKYTVVSHDGGQTMFKDADGGVYQTDFKNRVRVLDTAPEVVLDPEPDEGNYTESTFGDLAVGQYFELGGDIWQKGEGDTAKLKVKAYDESQLADVGEVVPGWTPSTPATEVTAEYVQGVEALGQAETFKEGQGWLDASGNSFQVAKVHGDGSITAHFLASDFDVTFTQAEAEVNAAAHWQFVEEPPISATVGEPVPAGGPSDGPPATLGTLDGYKSKWGSGGTYKHERLADLEPGTKFRDKSGALFTLTGTSTIMGQAISSWQDEQGQKFYGAAEVDGKPIRVRVVESKPIEFVPGTGTPVTSVEDAESPKTFGQLKKGTKFALSPGGPKVWSQGAGSVAGWVKTETGEDQKVWSLDTPVFDVEAAKSGSVGMLKKGDKFVVPEGYHGAGSIMTVVSEPEWSGAASVAVGGSKGSYSTVTVENEQGILSKVSTDLAYDRVPPAEPAAPPKPTGISFKAKDYDVGEMVELGDLAPGEFFGNHISGKPAGSAYVVVGSKVKNDLPYVEFYGSVGAPASILATKLYPKLIPKWEVPSQAEYNALSTEWITNMPVGTIFAYRWGSVTPSEHNPPIGLYRLLNAQGDVEQVAGGMQSTENHNFNPNSEMGKVVEYPEGSAPESALPEPVAPPAAPAEPFTPRGPKVERADLEEFQFVKLPNGKVAYVKDVGGGEKLLFTLGEPDASKSKAKAFQTLQWTGPVFDGVALEDAAQVDLDVLPPGEAFYLNGQDYQLLGRTEKGITARWLTGPNAGKIAFSKAMPTATHRVAKGAAGLDDDVIDFLVGDEPFAAPAPAPAPEPEGLPGYYGSFKLGDKVTNVYGDEFTVAAPTDVDKMADLVTVENETGEPFGYLPQSLGLVEPPALIGQLAPGQKYKIPGTAAVYEVTGPLQEEKGMVPIALEGGQSGWAAPDFGPVVVVSKALGDVEPNDVVWKPDVETGEGNYPAVVTAVEKNAAGKTTSFQVGTSGWYNNNDGWVSFEKPANASEGLPPSEVGDPLDAIPDYNGTDLDLSAQKAAGGTQGAKWAKGPDGAKWLIKQYHGDHDRVATELLGNAIYRRMGAKAAPAGQVTLPAGNIALTYEGLEGEPTSITAPSEVLGEHYMTDALLANWDFIGATDDNILWGPDGQPFRVDQGGVLFYRAQGGKKDFPADRVDEVESMLKPGQGQGHKKVVVTQAGLREQAEQIYNTLTPAVIDSLVDSAPFADEALREATREALKGRVVWMGDLAAGGEDFSPAFKKLIPAG